MESILLLVILVVLIMLGAPIGFTLILIPVSYTLLSDGKRALGMKDEMREVEPEAVEVARRVGFPAAMKVYSPHIIHKSDFGGVKINLSTPEAVRDAMAQVPLSAEQALERLVRADPRSQRRLADRRAGEIRTDVVRHDTDRDQHERVGAPGGAGAEVRPGRGHVG